MPLVLVVAVMLVTPLMPMVPVVLVFPLVLWSVPVYHSYLLFIL